MKAIFLFIVSLLLLAAGVWTLAAKFNGNMNLSFAWPLSGCSFDVSGSAKGATVVASLALVIASACVFVWAVLAGIAGRFRRSFQPAPEPEPAHKAEPANKPQGGSNL